jgi:thiol-disulfide isomerase/thioredoxin
MGSVILAMAEPIFSSPAKTELSQIELPDFELTDRQGKTHRLSDFKGNVVFLNFWATWCPPCIQELPSMEQLNQSLKAKNFQMIAVSVDQSWEEIDSFFQRMGWQPSFLILLDSQRVVAEGLYLTEKYPESYLLDAAGKRLFFHQGADNWMSPANLNRINEALRLSKSD